MADGIFGSTKGGSRALFQPGDAFTCIFQSWSQAFQKNDIWGNSIVKMHFKVKEKHYSVFLKGIHFIATELTLG